MTTTRDRSHLMLIRGCGYVPTDETADATGAPVIAVPEVAELAARACDELATIAEHTSARAGDLLAALSRGDTLTTVRAAIELDQRIRLIVSALGGLHTLLDEAGNSAPIGGV